MTHTLTLKHLFIYLSFGLVASPQSQPEMEYSLPELQAPRSNVADKPWPQVHSHTQRPHGENIHTTHKYCTWHFHHNLMWYIYLKGHFPHRLSQTYEPAENLCFCRCEGPRREGIIQSRRQREAQHPAHRRRHSRTRLPGLHVEVRADLICREWERLRFLHKANTSVIIWFPSLQAV